MKLEERVSNLELSQKLRDLGVEQDSYWYWFKGHHNEKWSLEPSILAKSIMKKALKSKKIFHAFTVAELGEMLPKTCYTRRTYDGFTCYKIRNKEKKPHSFREKTEANARAKMLIYLIENKLITGGFIK